MKILLSLIPCLTVSLIFTSQSIEALQSLHINFDHKNHFSLPDSNLEEQALTAFQYLLNEVELDAILTHEEQAEKILEFKNFAQNLSPELDTLLSKYLIEETRLRIIDILQNSELYDLEIDHYLSDYDHVILRTQNLNAEFARQLLFFVAELKIHRQYVYDFGIALGCPERQLLRHDLCKLHVEQFEGYARYFRGGKQETDKLAYLAAWKEHQNEEHHHEAYSKEGFDFETMTEERLRDNMLEAVADLQAATKQRGGSTLIDWLVNVFPNKNPHPRLIPHLKEALKKSHALYLASEETPDSNNLFKDLPCWNSEVEEVFNMLKSR